MVADVRDRATVLVDGKYVGRTYRTQPGNITVHEAHRMQILVENMGRINFSHGMDDTRKGNY